MMSGDRGEASPVIALGLGLVIPGGGHAYIGQWGKAVFFFLAIMTLVVMGMALGHGMVYMWQLWFAAQCFGGAPAWICLPISDYLSQKGNLIDWADRLHETGTLYTAVAGFLNILIMMDAYLKAAYPHHKPPTQEAL